MRDLITEFKDDLILIDRKAMFALIYTAVGLTATYYLRNPQVVATLAKGTALESVANFVAFNDANNLPGLAYWVVLVSVFYFVVPMLVIKFVWQEPLSSYGLRFTFERGFWKLYAISAAVMIPLVYSMSHTAGFLAKYPFLKVYNGDPYVGQTLLIWELIYFFQFFGLEFFFPRLSRAQSKASFRDLLHIRDDGSLLHDPFRQTTRRNARRDLRRNILRLA